MQISHVCFDRISSWIMLSMPLDIVNWYIMFRDHRVDRKLHVLRCLFKEITPRLLGSVCYLRDLNRSRAMKEQAILSKAKIEVNIIWCSHSHVLMDASTHTHSNKVLAWLAECVKGPKMNLFNKHEILFAKCPMDSKCDANDCWKSFWSH